MKRIEFTVSDEDWAELEAARGMIPRATYIKALLFDEHTDLPPIPQAARDRGFQRETPRSEANPKET